MDGFTAGWLSSAVRELLAVLGRDGGVFGDKRSHRAAHRFDTRTSGGSVSGSTSFTSRQSERRPEPPLRR